MNVVGRGRKRLEWLNNRYPPVRPAREAQHLIDSADAVISVGGDNYSEDYSGPFMPLIHDRYAMDHGKPTVLWGASVGPFNKSGRYANFMARHIRRYSRIHVREAYSEAYCRGRMGASRVEQFADPAFALEPEAANGIGLGVDGYIGVNVSPLVLPNNGAESVIGEVMKALQTIHETYGLSVLLVPHVMAYSGPNDDRRPLEALAGTLDRNGVPNYLVPGDLNAAQFKGVIGQCRVFVGARTHATIAAMSMGVPVISIGYSVKATGINEQVFGDDRYVLDYRRIEASLLADRIEYALGADGSALDSEARWRLRQDAMAAGVSLRELLEEDERERPSGRAPPDMRGSV